MNIIEKIILRIIKSKISCWFDLERSLSKMENVITSCDDSPEKSWPDPEKIPNGKEIPFNLKNIPLVGHNLKSCVSQGIKAIKSIKENPVSPRYTISTDELKDFEELAKSKGIGAVGYAKLDCDLIFKERAVLFDTCIILLMEMDKEAVSKAPSIDTFQMVMSTYDRLGIVTNQLTDKLRDMGISAVASHPLGGLVLYPPLAAAAGLGHIGRHGLLITPEFGPRQRISAIFVSANNLPISESNEHLWIEEFCKTCGNCIRTCPSKAILNKSIKHESGRETCIIREKCLPVFVKDNGCTVCVKECPFSKNAYSDLHERFKAGGLN